MRTTKAKYIRFFFLFHGSSWLIYPESRSILVFDCPHSLIDLCSFCLHGSKECRGVGGGEGSWGGGGRLSLGEEREE